MEFHHHTLLSEKNACVWLTQLHPLKQTIFLGKLKFKSRWCSFAASWFDPGEQEDVRMPCLGDDFGSRIKMQGMSPKSAEADTTLTIREKVLGGMVHICRRNALGYLRGGGDVPLSSGYVPRR